MTSTSKLNDVDPWMKGPCEVRANGYVYPCEVLDHAVLGKDNFVIRILLPQDGTHSMVVHKSMLMSRAHYNPIFDSEKSEKRRREEFLYPVGSFVKTKFNEKKMVGKVLKYNSGTGEYTVLCEHEGDSPFAIRRNEDQLKPVKEADVVPNREATEEKKVSDKVTVTETPLYEAGEKVLILTARARGTEQWMPGIIQRQDLKNPYIPMSGSRWFIKFHTKETLEWSYPAERIKKIVPESSKLYASSGWTAPKDKAYDYNFVDPKKKVDEEVKSSEPINDGDKFKADDKVEIVAGIFQGEKAVIVRKYREVIPLKKHYWIVTMLVNGKERIIAEENLKLAVADKPKEKVTEEPVETNEAIDDIIDAVTSFFGAVVKEVPVDLKKFIDLLGPIKEYKGKYDKKD